MEPDVKKFTTFLKTLDRKRFNTLHRKLSFEVQVVSDGLIYIPKSTGKHRPQQWKFIERVFFRFIETGSMHPGDYHDITVNASYVLTLIDLYLKKE